VPYSGLAKGFAYLKNGEKGSVEWKFRRIQSGRVPDRCTIKG